MTLEVYDKLDILIDTFEDLINDQRGLTPRATPERIKSRESSRTQITFKPVNELTRAQMNRSLLQVSQVLQLSLHSLTLIPLLRLLLQVLPQLSLQTLLLKRRYHYTPGLNQQKFLDNEDGFHHLKTNFPPSTRDKSFDSVFLD